MPKRYCSCGRLAKKGFIFCPKCQRHYDFAYSYISEEDEITNNKIDNSLNGYVVLNKDTDTIYGPFYSHKEATDFVISNPKTDLKGQDVIICPLQNPIPDDILSLKED